MIYNHLVVSAIWLCYACSQNLKTVFCFYSSSRDRSNLAVFPIVFIQCIFILTGSVQSQTIQTSTFINKNFDSIPLSIKSYNRTFTHENPLTASNNYWKAPVSLPVNFNNKHMIIKLLRIMSIKFNQSQMNNISIKLLVRQVYTFMNLNLILKLMALKI